MSDFACPCTLVVRVSQCYLSPILNLQSGYVKGHEYSFLEKTPHGPGEIQVESNFCGPLSSRLSILRGSNHVFFSDETYSNFF